jgi:hypothetical protein
LAEDRANASATDKELLRRFAVHRDQAAFAALWAGMDAWYLEYAGACSARNMMPDTIPTM